MTTKKITPFRLIFLVLFGFFGLAGVLGFAFYSGNVTGTEIGKVDIWGTVEEKVFNKFLEKLSEDNQDLSGVKYFYSLPEHFDSELAESIASGFGPDAFVIDQTQVIKHWFKAYTIPYDFMSRRDYLDTYIDASELLLSEKGIKAIPFAADPLVLYYNKDIFSEKGIAKPPKYWDEVISYSEKITEKDEDGAIEKAAIALGTFDNIKNAKDIIATMILQKNGRIVERTPEGRFVSMLANQARGKDSPVISALRFYTEFANPLKYFYTWNRALPLDQDMFVQDRLAMYIGYASEYYIIKEKNPNLNFDIAPIPQVRDKDAKVLTGGKIYGLALSRTSDNANGALKAIAYITSPQSVKEFNKMYVTVEPLRENLSEEDKENSLREVKRISALMMRSWLDPDPKVTSSIFSFMINSILSGKLDYKQAVTLAHRELKKYLDSMIK